MGCLLSSESADLDLYRETVLKTADAIVASIKDGKAYAGPEPRALSKIISSYEILPQHGSGFDSVLADLKKDVLPNFLRTFSTGYMAHLHSAALVESLAAELIISSFNQSMDSWDQSPVATEVEEAVTKFLASLYGLADGAFTSGGSQSNLTGILLARDWYCKSVLNHDVQKLGLPQNYSKLRLYTNAVSHFSMEKSCHLLGLGYNSVVKVPVTKNQKMDLDELERLIQKDKSQGNLPFCVVATIGTTDFGSIDEVEKIKQITDRYNMWLHADACYGSALVLSSKYKERMGNLGLCDSLSVDFHKMFLLPISCSCILLKDPSDFTPLEYHADYLNREEDEADGFTNLVDKSLQTTRRADALKVWVSFRTRGADGFEKIINTLVENAAYTYEKLNDASSYKSGFCFESGPKPQISSVVFRVKKDDGSFTKEQEDELNKKIRRHLLQNEGIVIGQTVYDERVFLKFTLLNPNVSHERLDGILDTILKSASTYGQL
ncbi:MAG: aspartate aminotransferase family protein [Treponema sp.]|nr:aspartate aminotransferase family protein [Treponema sp.]